MFFVPNLLSCIIRLEFRIVDLVNLVSNFRFLSLRVRKFIPNSLFDFSANLEPSRVIFYSVDSSLSSLSKNTNFPNFSLQFIVLFDQISKDLSKFPYFSVDSTLIHHYTS